MKKLILTTVLIAIGLWIELLYFVINSNWSLAWIMYCVIFGGLTIISLAGIFIEHLVKKNKPRNATLRGMK